MSIIAKLSIQVVAIGLAIILYKRGEYPEELDKENDVRNGKNRLIGLFIFQFVTIFLSIFILPQFFASYNINYFYISLVITILTQLSLVYLCTQRWGWDYGNFGFQRPLGNITLIAILGYILLGILRILFLLPNYVDMVMLLIYFYSNAFSEEFFNRAVVQTQFERLYNQRKTLIYQTIFFVLIHIPGNFGYLFLTGDMSGMILNFGFQIIHGFIYGLLFMKTRSIYPSIVVHYLTNWIGPWYFTLFG
ncbi:MAG: CPBP family intramembrane metalloprotease [Candidatus Heimdallarchaeota archaeon]|nr:CPBP family intramembrane metalloprotease [Candidatus Heimdallarchaeota archaeon]